MTGMIRIMCVDDDPDIRAIAVISLGLDAGTEVRSAGSGTEALALLDDATWRPDIVLLDVMMPDLDGPSVLDRIRSRPDWSALQVIFMTARVRQADIDAYRDLGATGVIVKPFDPLTLAREVRALAFPC